MLSRALAVVRSIENAGAVIAAAAVFAVMLIGVGEIFGRTLLGTPIYGQTDMVILLMPVIVFFGLSQCLRLDGHIQMLLLIDMLPGRPKAFAKAGGCLVSAAILSVLSWGAYLNFERALQFNDNTADLRVATWPFKLIVCFGLGLISLRFAIMAVGHFRQGLGAADPLQQALLPEVSAPPLPGGQRDD